QIQSGRTSIETFRSFTQELRLQTVTWKESESGWKKSQRFQRVEFCFPPAWKTSFRCTNKSGVNLGCRIASDTCPRTKREAIIAASKSAPVATHFNSLNHAPATT